MAESMYDTNNDFTQVQQQTGTQVGHVQNQYNVGSGAGFEGITGSSRDVLEQLIAQLMGTPALTPQQLDAQFALPVQSKQVVRSYTVGGPTEYAEVWTDPLTGRQISKATALALTEQRQRDKLAYASRMGTPAGTPEQQLQQQQRQLEIQRDREFQGQFTPEAAQKLSENLASYFSRKLGEESLQQITRGAEGAGTSASTARAELAQQATQRTSEVAAKTGADLATQFGGLQANFAQVLELLTRSDANAPVKLLLEALGLSKTQSQSNFSRGAGGSYPVSIPADSTTTTQRTGSNYAPSGDYDSGITYNTLTASKLPAAFYNAAGDYSSNDIKSGSGYITVGGGGDYESQFQFGG